MAVDPITPWRVQMFKLTEDCPNCGGPMLFGFPHFCRPVGEQRVREIIQEEIQSALKTPRPPAAKATTAKRKSNR